MSSRQTLANRRRSEVTLTAEAGSLPVVVFYDTDARRFVVAHSETGIALFGGRHEVVAAYIRGLVERVNLR